MPRVFDEFAERFDERLRLPECCVRNVDFLRIPGDWEKVGVERLVARGRRLGVDAGGFLNCKRAEGRCSVLVEGMGLFVEGHHALRADFEVA